MTGKYDKDMSIVGQGYKLPLILAEGKEIYLIKDSNDRVLLHIDKQGSEDYQRPRIEQMIDSVNIHEELVEVLEEAHILICNCMEKNISPLKEHPDPAAIYDRCESVLNRAKGGTK